MSSPDNKGFKQLTIDRSLPEAVYIQIADSEEIFRGGQIFIDDGIPDITRSPINELARASCTFLYAGPFQLFRVCMRNKTGVCVAVG